MATPAEEIVGRRTSKTVVFMYMKNEEYAIYLDALNDWKGRARRPTGERRKFFML